jgi:hypothetical protein
MIFDDIAEEDIAFLNKWAADNANTFTYTEHIKRIVLMLNKL